MGIVQDALARIKSAIKGEEVRGAIYDSIKYMDEEVQASESKFSPSIQGSGLSNEITINDGSDFKLADLVIYGNITQDGTPSKSNYVPMIFAGNELSITITISNGGGNNHTFKVSTPDYLPAILLKDTDTDSGAITVGGKKFLPNEINYGLKKMVNRLIRLELTSSLNWKLDSEEKRIYYDPFEDLRTAIGSPIASNYFVRGDWTTAASGTAFLGDGTHDYIGVSKDEFGSVDAFKAWLDEKKGEGHPCYILVPYRVPQEKELSDVDIQNFNALHTYKPKTVISNNSTAFLKVVYTADTLVYIQQNTVKEIDYANVTNKPKINDFTIEGNVSLDDIGAQPKGNYVVTSDFNAIKEDVSENKDAITELQRSKADAIVETASGESLHVEDASGNGLHNLKVFGKATQDGTPAPEAPVDVEISGSDGNVRISFVGKNLIDNDNPTFLQNVTRNGDEFLFDSVSDSVVQFSLPRIPRVTDSFTVRFKAKAADSESVGVTVVADFYPDSFGGDVNVKINSTEYTDVSMLMGKAKESDGEDCIFRVYVSSSQGGKKVLVKDIMLTYGGEEQEYTDEYSKQEFIAQTPNGLPGIPVESGGNYTDETGQQWVSDYIDFERGKYVQNVQSGHIDSANESAIIRGSNNRFYFNLKSIKLTDAKQKNYSSVIQHEFCNIASEIAVGEMLSTEKENVFIAHGNNVYFRIKSNTTLDEFKQILAKGIDFVYPLETPVETDLSAEEIAAYKALHTNKTVTNVFSDSDPQVGIQMEYGADAKTYIDKKFEAMTASMLKIESEVK